LAAEKKREFTIKEEFDADMDFFKRQRVGEIFWTIREAR